MNMKILARIGLFFFVKTNEVIYFDSFGIEHIPKEIEHAIGNKTLKVTYLDYKHMIQLCVDIIA